MLEGVEGERREDLMSKTTSKRSMERLSTLRRAMQAVVVFEDRFTTAAQARAEREWLKFQHLPNVDDDGSGFDERGDR